MTPVEQARADVEAWFDEASDSSDAGYSTITAVDLPELISRLTPIYERAQRFTVDEAYAAHPLPPGEHDALRERAERAEAAAESYRQMNNAAAVARIATVEATLAEMTAHGKIAYWRREFQRADGELLAERVHSGLQREWREAAEADVARLREALRNLIDNRYDSLAPARAALAAPEPRR